MPRKKRRRAYVQLGLSKVVPLRMPYAMYEAATAIAVRLGRATSVLLREWIQRGIAGSSGGDSSGGAGVGGGSSGDPPEPGADT